MSDYTNLAEQADKLLKKIKELFSGKNEEAKPPTDAEKEGNGALIEKLRELEKAYEDRITVSADKFGEPLAETLGLVPLTYEEKPEEEIRKEAETSLLPDYQKKLDAASETLTEKTGKLEQKLVKAGETKEEDSADLNSKLDALLKKQREAVIKQGIVNSSINAEGKKEIEGYGAQEFEKIDAEYDQKYTSIKAETSLALQSYENAIKGYDLKYAADLEKRLLLSKPPRISGSKR